MTYKLLTAAAFSLALGTAAIAQTQTEGTTQPGAGAAPAPAAEGSLPSGWEGAVGDAFFSDPELGTLRSQDEIQANWQNLSEEQQAQVRAHCETVDTAAAGTTEAPAGDTTAGATDQDDAGVTTGSTAPDSAMHTASIEQICDWVDTM